MAFGHQRRAVRLRVLDWRCIGVDETLRPLHLSFPVPSLQNVERSIVEDSHVRDDVAVSEQVEERLPASVPPCDGQLRIVLLETKQVEWQLEPDWRSTVAGLFWACGCRGVVWVTAFVGLRWV